MKRLAWLGLCALLFCGGGALAAGRSVSYSTWVIADNTVALRFLLPVAEASRLMGAGVPVLTTDRLKDYLLQHVAVSSAGGACPAIDQGYDLGQVDPLAVGPDLYGFELVFRCVDPRQLLLRESVLFGTVPDHVNFARIQLRGAVVEQLFTRTQQRLALPDGGTPAAAGLLSYVGIGFTHILGSPDRWCVLLGALLLVQRRRELTGVIVALTAGYLLSALVAASGWVLPRAAVAEAFVGLLVALLGARLALREGLPRRAAAIGAVSVLLLLTLVSLLLHEGPAAQTLLGAAALAAGVLLMPAVNIGMALTWQLLVVLFAFLDGIAMSAVLPAAQLAQGAQLRMGLGFDAGALLFDALAVAVAAVIVLIARAPRVHALRKLVDDLGAALLSGLGAFWLLSRIWA